MIEEIRELNAIRLDEDLTLQQLADEITDANDGAGVDASTLSRIFDDPERVPFDRTLHKIRKYLQAKKAPRRPARRHSVRP